MANLRDLALQAAEKARAKRDSKIAAENAKLRLESEKNLAICLKAELGPDLVIAFDEADGPDGYQPAVAIVDGLRFSLYGPNSLLCVEMPCRCGRSQVWESLPVDALATLGEALAAGHAFSFCKTCADENLAAHAKALPIGCRFEALLRELIEEVTA